MGFNQAAGLAQSATGTTPEAEAAKAAARDLASTLPQSTETYNKQALIC